MDLKQSNETFVPINIINADLSIYRPKCNDYVFADIPSSTEIALPVSSIDFVFYIDDVNYKLSPTNFLKITIPSVSSDTVNGTREVTITTNGALLHITRKESTKAWNIENIRVPENVGNVTRTEFRNHERKIGSPTEYAHLKVSDSVGLVSNDTAASSTAVKTAWERIINVESRLNNIGGDIGNRRINTAFPLFGGGTLASDVSLGIGDCSTTQRGVVQIGNGLSVQNSVVSVNYGSIENTACQGNDVRLYNKRVPVSHLSETNEYGIATADRYGHVKISNNIELTDTDVAASIDVIKPIYAKITSSNNAADELKAYIDAKRITANHPLFGGGTLSSNNLNISINNASEGSPGVVYTHNNYLTTGDVQPPDPAEISIRVPNIKCFHDFKLNVDASVSTINAYIANIKTYTVNTAAPLRGGGNIWDNNRLLSISIDDTSNAQKGVMQVGAGLWSSNGVVNVAYGDTPNTSCQGNDMRLNAFFPINGVASISGNTLNVDLSTGLVFNTTFYMATTVQFINQPANKNALVVLKLINGGNYSITWPSFIKWPSGKAPKLTVNGADEVNILFQSNGTTTGVCLSDMR